MIEFTEDKLIEILEEQGCPLTDGFNEAIVSVTVEENPVTVYDYMGCIDILMYRRDLDYGAAVEYMEVNVIAPTITQDRAPIFIQIPCSPSLSHKT